jgi:hypothetical protein
MTDGISVARPDADRSLTIYEPKQQTEQCAEDHRRRYWQIEAEVATLDGDIPREMPEAKLLNHRPQKP